MALVITRLCRGCVDGACLDVCPTECITEHAPEGRSSELPRQLYINPDNCIDCGACIQECPVEAIMEQENVPQDEQEDIALNARSGQLPHEYRVPRRDR